LYLTASWKKIGAPTQYSLRIPLSFSGKPQTFHILKTIRSRSAGRLQK
jgi:hypothetical protein